MRVVSGHQPTYLPWAGLIHKASLCDDYVFMDDVQYLEQDWNNRNRIKTGTERWHWLTVPVDLKNSQSKLLKDILIKDQTHLSPSKRWNQQHWKSLSLSYGKAPFFKTYAPFFEWLYLDKEWEHLSALNETILRQMFEWFHIKTRIHVASTLNFTRQKSDLILEHARYFNADLVVTGMHGEDYIEADAFEAHGTHIYFQSFQSPTYSQRFKDFIPSLSFVDLLFNVGPAEGWALIQSPNLTREELCHQYR